MGIEFDAAKAAKTRMERGLDFAQAGELFEGLHYTLRDDRFDYGEDRYITAGFLDDRMVVAVWTQRGDRRRIISMRKANAREQALYKKYLDRS